MQDIRSLNISRNHVLFITCSVLDATLIDVLLLLCV